MNKLKNYKKTCSTICRINRRNITEKILEMEKSIKEVGIKNLDPIFTHFFKL